MKEKIMDKLGDWLDNCSYVLEDIGDWFLDAWPVILTIALAILFIGFVGYCIAYASGAFFDEVENYDFTAQVYDKDHYTTQSVSYITSGKTRVPVYHTLHHYKIMWEDGEERGALEIGEDHYNLIKIGDFVNLHCSVRADKQGELHYYYSFKGY